MDLQERVMEILDGRIKMGAGKKNKHVLNRVPPMYEVPNSLHGQRTTPLARQYVGQTPMIPMEMLEHHFPTESSIQVGLIDDLARVHALVPASTDEEQVSKSMGGKKPKCRKGCKHIRCAASKMAAADMNPAGGVQIAGGKKKKSKQKKEKYPYEGRMRDHRWTDFVKEFAKLNNMSYKEAMVEAAPYYKDRSPKGGSSRPTGGKTAKRKHRKNEWLDYVREFAKLNNMSFRDAMKAASKSYHEQA